jgi:hypothetical protein
MAFAQRLPDDVLAVIADQVKSSLEDSGDVGGMPVGGPVPPSEPTSPPDAPPLRYTIGDSFELWTFARGMTKEFEAGNRDLSALLRHSGVWHHQLNINEIPAGFARSKPLGPTPDSWSVKEIFWSPLAKNIDKAIDWIDEHVPDGVEARLLSAPFQQTEAFWFVTAPNSENADEWNDKLLIVVSSKHLKELKPGTLVDSATFLRFMASPKPGEKLNRKRVKSAD